MPYFFTVKKIKISTGLLDTFRVSLLNDFGFNPETSRYVLITAHRRENFGVGLENICFSIKQLAINNPSVFFVYPVHLNPSVKDIVYKMLGGLNNIILIPPQDYLNFTWLLLNSYFVLTDSGGIQEEAPALGKPVLVMRDNSERPEAIASGTAKLVTTNPEKLIFEAQRLLSEKEAYEYMARAENPYGDGNAAIRIVNYFK